MALVEEAPRSRQDDNPDVEVSVGAAPWGLPLRIAFRFCFCYLLVYFNVAVLEVVPWLGSAAYRLTSGLGKAVVPWVGLHVLHLSTPVLTYAQNTGSGDTLFDWVGELVYLAVAAGAAVVWSLFDRRRSDYRRLAEWALLYARLNLAFALFSYGLAKVVVAAQFPYPADSALLRNLGELTPISLLWAFMGYSPAFGGSLETLGGVLVCFRRTATLGALVAAGVLTNVVMLNLCYDVPVKLFSTHLLLLCLFILAPDLGRLAQMLVLDRPTVPRPRPPLLHRPWARRTALILQIALAAGTFGVYVHLYLGVRSMTAALQRQVTLGGTYDVQDFVRDNRPVPPLLTDTGRWRRVFITTNRYLLVSTMDDAQHRYLATYDLPRHTLTLADPRTKATFSVLAWRRPDPDHLVLSGQLGGQAILVTLRRNHPETLPLTGRGFRWIAEASHYS
jgi:hypothetical protein